MKISNCPSLALAAAALALVSVPAAFAGTIYDVTFSGGGASASGWVDVSGGVAIAGSLDVTGTPTLDSTYTLVTPVPGSGSVRDNLNGLGTGGGDDMIFDNDVSPTETYLDQDGLGFAIGYNGAGSVDAFANLWENSPDNYNLYVAGNIGGGYGYLIYGGGGSVTPVGGGVPDGGMTITMLGFATAALAAFRRRFV
jgi:hypothetical protein